MSISEEAKAKPVAIKNDAGKAPLYLIPPRPLVETAQVLEFGVQEYAAWNWSKGFAASRLYGALLRHLFAWWGGEELDRKSGLPHLAHAMCNLLFIMDLRHTKPPGWVDDRPGSKAALAFPPDNEVVL